MRDIIAFDIETIPDIEALNLLLPGEDLCGISEAEKRKKMEEYHLKITDGKNGFHRQLFHKIICLSLVKATESDGGYEISCVKTIGRQNGHEEETIQEVVPEEKIVRGFCQRLNEMRPFPKLITFNGRGFDIPVIKYRAMKYGVSWAMMMDKGYSYRYGLENNLDLLEVLSDFGSSARVKLSEVCALLKIPCKSDMQGCDVADRYDQGRIKDVENYCEIDALVTFIVYLRYRVLEGILSPKSYNNSVKNLLSWIDKEGRGHLTSFAESWEGMGEIFLAE